MKSTSPRVLIQQAAGIADDELQDLLAVSDADLSANDWLLALARIGNRRQRMQPVLRRVAVKLGLPRSAKERLLMYLTLRLYQVVEHPELAAVAGISEWPRRIRELRVEEGWPISSNVNDPTLRPGQYRLEAAERDASLAQRWHVLNRIRRQSGSGKSRLLAAFRANVGDRLSKEDLGYVAQIQEHPRRVRELTEEGWQIHSNLDDPSLASGQYVLISNTQLPARARRAVKLRFEIMERDHYACVRCGTPAGKGRRLQVHHLRPVADGGDNQPTNLQTLCEECHAGQHAIGAAGTTDELLLPEGEPPLLTASGN